MRGGALSQKQTSLQLYPWLLPTSDTTASLLPPAVEGPESAPRRSLGGDLYAWQCGTSCLPGHASPQTWCLGDSMGGHLVKW